MKQLTSPAREILDYVLQHPGASDTFDGIAQWWLLEQQLRTWLPRVDQAIHELVALGLLQAARGPDGVVRYRGDPAALATYRAAVPAPRRRRAPPRVPPPDAATRPPP